MDHIGIDVHKRESQIYCLAQGGEVVEQRIRTEPERFAHARFRRFVDRAWPGGSIATIAPWPHSPL